MAEIQGSWLIRVWLVARTLVHSQGLSLLPSTSSIIQVILPYLSSSTATISSHSRALVQSLTSRIRGGRGVINLKMATLECDLVNHRLKKYAMRYYQLKVGHGATGIFLARIGVIETLEC